MINQLFVFYLERFMPWCI